MAAEPSFLRALVIDDKEFHAVHTCRLLRKAGFSSIVVCRSAKEGIEEAKRLLNRAFSPQVNLIVLDWRLPHALSPSLEGIVVAAELVRAMDEGEIHPTHLAVVTHNPTGELRQDAFDVGCSIVLSKPLVQSSVQQLRALVDQPLRYPLTDQRRYRYRRILRFVRPTIELLCNGADTAASFYWERKSLKRLLKAGVILDLDAAERRWVEQHGGLEAVRRYLRVLAIEDNDLARLRDLLLDTPEKGWEWYATTMSWGKTYFFDHRNKLFDLLALALNHWSAESRVPSPSTLPILSHPASFRSL